MDRKYFLVFMLSFMMLFAGCTGGGSSSSSGGGSGGSFGSAFNGGDAALEIEFTKGQPPEKIRDGGLQPFTIRAMVKNVGEYDIPEGETNVFLSGISLADFGLETGAKDLPALRGVKKQGENTIPGTVQPVMYSNLKYIPQLPSGTNTQNMYLDICYPYQTKSLVNLCVSGSTLQSFDEDLKVCDVDSTRSFANSGAPVKIENVKQSPSGPSSIMIQFDIVHNSASSSNGRVYQLGVMDDKCKVEGKPVSSSEAVIKENYVKYTLDTGIEGIDCGSSGENGGEVLLVDGTATVYCVQDTTDQEDYERPITVTLEYDYFDRISTSMQIEHISQ